MNREETYEEVCLILLFLFGLCVGLIVGHLLTERYWMNLERKIDAIVQSYEAKYLLRNEVKK